MVQDNFNSTMPNDNQPRAMPDAAADQQPTRSLGDIAADAKSAVTTEAGNAASSIREGIEERAEDWKRQGADSLRAFSDAMRTASDTLAEKQQPGPIIDLMQEAAGGLEKLSGAMSGKSTGDMVVALRDLGRSNPLAFVAGSVLAGFALGRFASMSRASSPASGNAGTRADMPGEL